MMMRHLCMLVAVLGAGCADAGTVTAAADTPSQPGSHAIEPAPGTRKPPFEFHGDEKLLDDIQRGCFLFFWHEVSPKTGMVVDRTSATIVSVAGVGFQLSSLPIGVERKWVTKDEARTRALLILSSLSSNPANRRRGLFYHYLDPDTAGPHSGSHEHVISTIDSAILLAGVATAGEYFGGEVKQAAETLVRAADWRSYVLEKSEKAYEQGFISLGFRPADPADPEGAGELLPYVWADAGDEQRLVTFLAVGAPDRRFRVDPEVYYKMRRQLGRYGGVGELVWFPWSGALFTNIFSHCWIDYRSIGTDNPTGFGVAHRPPVDWWENSRRAVEMHRLKCDANPKRFKGWGKNVWGLSASDAPAGYAVPGVFPDPVTFPGAKPNVDFAVFEVKDDLGDGTIPPYAAGASIMFEPSHALDALRHYQSLKGPDGSPLVWREPNPASREYGFRDAFNIEKGWVATDYVAIDQGPLLLGVENARTGLIWKVFRKSEVAQGAEKRLRKP